jgi:predicted DNA-binding protein (MmcQ/YjbR family)
MVSIETFRKIALSLPATNEEPHFETTSFRVNKKIFATLNGDENRATIKLSEIDQDTFCIYDKKVMYPVPNKWGKQGWTHINLKTIRKEMCVDALTTAYCEVAPEKLSSIIKNK